jgi:hypothetical protein
MSPNSTIKAFSVRKRRDFYLQARTGWKPARIAPDNRDRAACTVRSQFR